MLYTVKQDGRLCGGNQLTGSSMINGIVAFLRGSFHPPASQLAVALLYIRQQVAHGLERVASLACMSWSGFQRL